MAALFIKVQPVVCIALLLQLCCANRVCRDRSEFVPKSLVQDQGAVFHFSKCSRDTNCSACSDNDAAQIVHDADICEDTGQGGVCKYEATLPCTKRHFSVNIPGNQFDHADQYNYNITYRYSCEGEQPSNESVLCPQLFHLNLGVTDFNLKVISGQAIVGVDGTDAIVSPQEGDTVTLECSSGLPNDVSLPVHFFYIPESDPHTKRIMICEEYYHTPIYYGENWIVERQKQDTHSCRLHIKSVSQNESGTYGCVGILPHGLGDWCKRNISIILASKIDSPKSIVPNPTTFATIFGGIFAVFVSLIVVTVIGFCAVITISAKMRNRGLRPNPDPDPGQRRNNPNQPPGPGPQEGQHDNDIRNPLLQTDEEQTHPRHNSGHYGSIDPRETYRVQGAEVSDIEIEEDAPTVTNNAIEVPVHVEPLPPPSVARSQVTLVPFGSQGQPNAIPPRPTSTATDPPALHPQDNPASSPESTIIPNIGAALPNGNHFPPEFVIQPPPDDQAVRPPSGPPSLAESHSSQFSGQTGSRPELMFQLEYSTEISQSRYSSHSSTSSQDSKDSEDRRALNVFKNQTATAEGATPESRVPVDPNLTCPKCGKGYRGDQIQYYKRHVQECTGQTDVH